MIHLCPACGVKLDIAAFQAPEVVSKGWTLEPPRHIRIDENGYLVAAPFAYRLEMGGSEVIHFEAPTLEGLLALLKAKGVELPGPMTLTSNYEHVIHNPVANEPAPAGSLHGERECTRDNHVYGFQRVRCVCGKETRTPMW